MLSQTPLADGIRNDATINLSLNPYVLSSVQSPSERKQATPGSSSPSSPDLGADLPPVPTGESSELVSPRSGLVDSHPAESGTPIEGQSLEKLSCPPPAPDLMQPPEWQPKSMGEVQLDIQRDHSKPLRPRWRRFRIW